MAKKLSKPSTIRKYARMMRRKPTPAEAVIAWNLRRWGLPFKAQRIVDQFIVDFLLIDRRLVIEVDGPSHRKTDRKRYDALRQQQISSLLGVSFLRVSNNEVLNTDCEELKRKILAFPTAIERISVHSH